MLTDQRQTAHPSPKVNCQRRCHFPCLSIKELTLESEFEVVNALLINDKWLWRLEIPLRFPFRIIGHFHQLSGSKGHVECLWALLKVPYALRRLSQSRRSEQQVTRPNPTLWVILIQRAFETSLVVLSVSDDEYSCPFLLHIV